MVEKVKTIAGKILVRKDYLKVRLKWFGEYIHNSSNFILYSNLWNEGTAYITDAPRHAAYRGGVSV